MLGQIRVHIQDVYPETDRIPVRRIPGELVEVEARIYGDGHDLIRARILYRHEGDKKWKEEAMIQDYEDHWKAAFRVEKEGIYYYTIEGWVDHALSWQHSLKRRLEGKEKIQVELKMGAVHLEQIVAAAGKAERKNIEAVVALLRNEKKYDEAVEAALGSEVEGWILKYPAMKHVNRFREMKVTVEHLRTRFSTWYELFPRSASREAGRHGTFADVELLLPRLAEMGIDVLYFPPIHPIGKSFRKGKNNSLKARPGEPGVPWAIGNGDKGHKDIHPELGTLQDFHSLIKKAAAHGIDIALDYALQCSPDHPYLKEHPGWFYWRPDGSVQYAENPPKKYQDAVPFNFENEDWKNMWEEFKSILEYWIRQGVKIFRVDNPHTKSLFFWEWVIAEIKKKHPDTIFLSEAFTKPSLMYHLARCGFNQSYTYFTWKNSKAEITEYLTELTQTEVREYFQPNFWPNTPDILPFHLQKGHEAMFITRLFMAATLSSSYGFYGPVYELMISEALPGREEYMNSEKYEIRNWDWDKDNRLKMLIGTINRARRENAALQQTNRLEFLNIQNDHLLAYYKESGTNRFICVVNLDPEHKQQGFLQTPLEKIGKQEGQPFIVHDLLNDARYEWSKRWNYVELDPYILPCHLFRIEEA